MNFIRDMNLIHINSYDWCDSLRRASQRARETVCVCVRERQCMWYDFLRRASQPARETECVCVRETLYAIWASQRERLKLEFVSPVSSPSKGRDREWSQRESEERVREYCIRVAERHMTSKKGISHILNVSYESELRYEEVTLLWSILSLFEESLSNITCIVSEESHITYIECSIREWITIWGIHSRMKHPIYVIWLWVTHTRVNYDMSKSLSYEASNIYVMCLLTRNVSPSLMKHSIDVICPSLQCVAACIAVCCSVLTHIVSLSLMKHSIDVICPSSALMKYSLFTITYIGYGVATISRLLKSLGLFCRI